MLRDQPVDSAVVRGPEVRGHILAHGPPAVRRDADVDGLGEVQVGHAHDPAQAEVGGEAARVLQQHPLSPQQLGEGADGEPAEGRGEAVVEASQAAAERAREGGLRAERGTGAG